MGSFLLACILKFAKGPSQVLILLVVHLFLNDHINFWPYRFKAFSALEVFPFLPFYAHPGTHLMVPSGLSMMIALVCPKT